MSDKFDDEDEGADVGEEGDGGSGYFDSDTEGVLIAGRCFGSSSLTRGQLEAFAREIDALGERHGLRLAVVPAGDLTRRSGPKDDDSIYSAIHVGLQADRGGIYGPSPVSREAVLGKLAEANKIPEAVWAEIGEKLPGTDKTVFQQSKVALFLTCVGPLAGAKLAFGQVGPKSEGGKGEFTYGQDMEQEPHYEGVWGERVASVHSEGSDSEEIDLGDEAHAALVEELGDVSYYLVARFD